MARDKRLEKANRVLDEEIAALRDKAAQNKKRRARQPAAVEVASAATQSGGGQTPTATTQPAAAAPAHGNAPSALGSSEQSAGVESLDATAERLKYIRDVLNTDPALVPHVARAVGVEEGKYLRRNLMLNVVLSTIFLIAGWLLSTVATPTTLSRIFGH